VSWNDNDWRSLPPCESDITRTSPRAPGLRFGTRYGCEPAAGASAAPSASARPPTIRLTRGYIRSGSLPIPEPRTWLDANPVIV
jgi:hypothetical protein